jgi:hypothetical protein
MGRAWQEPEVARNTLMASKNVPKDDAADACIRTSVCHPGNQNQSERLLGIAPPRRAG